MGKFSSLLYKDGHEDIATKFGHRSYSSFLLFVSIKDAKHDCSSSEVQVSSPFVIEYFVFAKTLAMRVIGTS